MTLNRKLKILQISISGDVAGRDIAMLTLSDLLIKDGHKVDIFGPQNELRIFCENYGFKVSKYCIKNTKEAFFKGLPHIFNLMLKEKYDIVHCHQRIYSIFIRIFGFLLSIPVINTQHSNDRLKRNKYRDINHFFKFSIKRYLDNLTILFYGHIIAVSKTIVRDLINQKINSKKITLVYNTVFYSNNNNDIKYQLREKYNIKDSSKILGYFGRLCDEKGVFDILKVAKMLKMKSCDFQFFLFGLDMSNGENIDRYEKFIIENNLNSVIHFEGFVSNSLFYISQLDMLVQPSWDESFGLTIIEAMKQKIPIIASNTSGPSEILKKFPNNLFTAKNNKQLFSYIYDFLKGNYIQNIEDQFKYYENHFSNKVMLRKTIDVYDKLLKDRGI